MRGFMRRLRSLLLSVLVLVLASCSELPAVDPETYTGTLTGTVAALSPDRSSLRVGNTRLLLARSTDVILPSSISYTKVYSRGRMLSIDALKIGQKVRLKARQGFIVELWISP